jgi:hypothetical protein
LSYFVWTDDKETIKHARTLESKLFSDFGKQKKRAKGFGFFGGDTPYDEHFQWNLDGTIQHHLEYIDDLGMLPELSPRPPVSIVVSADFWLAGSEETDTMKSHVIAWFSPASNSISFTLNFPYSAADDNFLGYRKKLQIDCPIQLKDKYFYVRKKDSKGSCSFRKLY